MPRNLDRRVEAIVPVVDHALKTELETVLDLCLQDNRQAWDMQPDGSYRQRKPANEKALSSQQALMDRATRQMALR